ncbi:ABC-type transporter Mla maintaining outer membrane lipid asymmetry, MlaB component, contains STAS domain [Streptomyces sp. SolWspMP-5a-2]|nr:ABC-type transporter Mla maintaining outer membrane lipid asymmetry, MlaB component, contains STAS domain [Streptomyces sp. SolWspMP-5a-2]
MTPSVLVLRGPVGPAELTGLCDAVRAGLGPGSAGAVVVDVGPLGAPDLGTVDTLAWLQLTARRAGGRILLRAPGPALRALLDLVGLPVGVEVRGDPEEREPPLGVEVEVEPGEPAV